MGAGAALGLDQTLDDATSEHYSMFFVGEEGTMSSLGVQEVIASRGLFPASIRTGAATTGIRRKRVARWTASTSPIGQALQRLGIEMIPAYSPEARGRSERMFRTHQDRLPRELALAGITDMVAANRYLTETHRPAFNAEFMQPAMEEGSAFCRLDRQPFEDILCERLNAKSVPIIA